MSFFDEFNQIVPYSVKVNVGKNKQFKTDPSKKSDTNHKGKMVSFYKKAETFEELEKHGLGEYMTYLPAEEVSMPIDIEITSDEEITSIFEKTSKYTNRKNTNHKIRIFNNDKAQIGYVSFSLTPSGDIDQKTSFYDSPNGTEKIMHIIYNSINNGNLIKDDTFEFQKNNEDGTKKIYITQRNGKVVGASVTEQELETWEDVAFQSITHFSKDEKTPKLKRYVASCVVDETDCSKRGGSLFPWECATLEKDLFAYQEAMDDFQQHMKWFKEKTGIDVSIEKCIELENLSYDEQEKQGFSSPQFNIWYYSSLANYLSDESNNILKDFKGNYIGNILRLTDNGYEACIVTKHQKANKNYRLYTLIDFSGTSITQGTGVEAVIGTEDRDPNYFERLETADKTPTFVTEIDKDGNEKLVLYKGNAISKECPEYEDFVENFIAPFSEIKPIQISKVLNRENKMTR